MRGKFISLEGGEGSGKSTAMANIQNWLESQHIDYVMTREPGGTPLAEDIRNLVLSPREEIVDDMAELLMMFAARSQHISQKIEPALAQGTWVISDRFIDSTYVYQGIARGGDIAILDHLTQWVVGNCQTDATLLLDVPVEIGQKRVQQRKHSDRLDKESHLFHEKVRQGFLDRAHQNPQRIKLIDASQSLESVKQQIQQQLKALQLSWSKSEK
ncbi:Thymidylate kinase [Marinomonas spartinae]|uniref:Thymidylate kinase n=1 Tax=Marinomonas spartinae TaxID=1792290 RepID=A0A1A8TMJ1_9GAMM|nr:dTMP kinase [Marinomonas spartinae]SBS33814.1 Thymidylate kinase [Marinomonas spartinae]SBS38092.1 Thymidylate kinase [Marinomonas spartinae]